MAILGIESTAHTFGVGIAEADPGDPQRCRILANQRDMLRPDDGGIVPREAAEHHSDVAPGMVEAALAEADLRMGQVEGIAFSQGPGMGPCLRVGATVARALALRHDVPLLGVNHCVSHLEIGRGLTDAKDPVLLYASGANTQVIAFVRGRYRVFGETLDVGIGNGLDKFARDAGIPFPGGPEIEKLAATSDAWHDMPYTVKGMDMVFAGLATKSRRLLDDGVPLPEVCNSLQEHAFAALVEVAERALAHTQKDELVLGGGVACNARLQQMAQMMCEDRGADFYCPPRPVLIDNGAMIAWNGVLLAQAGAPTPVEQSAVDAHWRTEQVDAVWRQGGLGDPSGSQAAALAVGADAGSHDFVPIRGAEATVSSARFLGRDAVVKTREPKRYRDPRLDERIRGERCRDEANLLLACRNAGVAAPVVLDADLSGAAIRMSRIRGEPLRTVLAARATVDQASVHLAQLGHGVARLHDAGLTHGDLTTSNVLVDDGGDLVFIDFGLGQFSQEDEPRGVDLHLVEEALSATHEQSAVLFETFLDAYREARQDGKAEAAVTRLEDIRQRGRYR